MKKRNKTNISKLKSTGSAEPPGTVLHIDDEPNDAELLRAAFAKAGLPQALHHVADVEDAMAYFHGTGKFADRHRFPLPILVLLDIKMPRDSGFEILKWIRSQREISQVPVLVLSGSELRDDVEEAYAAGANSYLLKPLGFEALVGLAQNINSVWVTGRMACAA